MHAARFWDVVQGKVEGGKYGTPKFLFFLILGISAVLDLPTFIACASLGGPNQCEWDDVSYAFCWGCHLVALLGYVWAVITPSLLWSDITQTKDGMFWNSASPLDYVKVYFRITYVVFCCIILSNIIGLCLFFNASNESKYTDSNAIAVLNNILTPVLLLFVVGGCAGCGRRLVRYVVNVKLQNTVQMRVLLKLRFSVLLICTTYLVRAFLVASLYRHMPQAYIDFFAPARKYYIWLVATQWFPLLLCSYCLVYDMRLIVVDKSSTSSSRSSSLASSSAGAPTGDPNSSNNKHFPTGGSNIRVITPHRHSEDDDGDGDGSLPSQRSSREQNYSVESVLSDAAASINSSTSRSRGNLPMSPRSMIHAGNSRLESGDSSDDVDDDAYHGGGAATSRSQRTLAFLMEAISQNPIVRDEYEDSTTTHYSFDSNSTPSETASSATNMLHRLSNDNNIDRHTNNSYNSNNRSNAHNHPNFDHGSVGTVGPARISQANVEPEQQNEINHHATAISDDGSTTKNILHYPSEL